MNKVFCDRCGKECVEGSAYYKIDIYGYDTNPTNDGRTSLDAATQNTATNILKVLGKERHYCKRCKDEIVHFMFNNDVDPVFRPDQIKEAVERRAKGDI